MSPPLTTERLAEIKQYDAKQWMEQCCIDGPLLVEEVEDLRDELALAQSNLADAQKRIEELEKEVKWQEITVDKLENEIKDLVRDR